MDKEKLKELENVIFTLKEHDFIVISCENNVFTWDKNKFVDMYKEHWDKMKMWYFITYHSETIISYQYCIMVKGSYIKEREV